MALKATIYKTSINIADMDREVYLDQNLTIAQHPSETLQRMMLRIMAWALNAHEQLTFTKGLCDEDEPELWIKNYSDEIELWVELGLPDEKRLKKSSIKGQKVALYTYNKNAAEVWWKQNASVAAQYKNLSVFFVDDESMAALANAASRTMKLQVTIQDGQIWLNTEAESLLVNVETWQQGE
ncbi:YaeQ family protein [Vibrio sp. Of7-15]|uniref:YaeQ family protein n=1 Tax=Vibrio sp. Of7-15 TaxID=2724879 RepID=UPI001EF2D227|nr:YaeQ family protein [Vibrio sp. Of7-15]MCG7496515.1 YaeQ family protein [Vibrio sp. Of7-15]